MRLPARIFSVSNIRSRYVWRTLKIALIAASAVLLALIWGFTLYGMQREEALTIQNARIAQNNLNIVVAANLRQLFQQGQAYALASSTWQQRPHHTHDQHLAELRAGDQTYNRLALFNLDGKLQHESARIDDNAGISHFIRKQRLTPGTNSPAFMIGPQAPSVNQSWQVPLLFPVAGAQGELVGILEADLDLGYLLRLYQSMDIGPNGDISIVDADGGALVRASRGGLEIRPPEKSRSASVVTSTQAVASYPLMAMITQSTADILAGFNAGKQEQISSMLLLSLMITGMTLLAIVLLSQHRSYFEELINSKNEKQLLIEQLENEKKRAYELAAHDHLTGLLNRRMFSEMAASHIASARRNRQNSAILFIDLDRFKQVNDTLGHNVGDRLLQSVAQRLRENLRESDVISRFGGDEFVLMLTALESESHVEAIANKLKQALSLPYPGLGGHTVQTSPSIGISIYPRDGSNIETLLLNADAAMYQTKSTGRGNYVFFDPSIKNNSILEFELEQRLPAAIEAAEFVLHFQPKVGLQSFHITGFEALIRWQHPQHGLIFPNSFIPLAEASGHITELGAWTIEAACLQLNEWKDAGLPLLPVAINLSGKQLHDKQLAKTIIATLQRHGLPPSLLQIEVTENSLVENIEIAGAILEELVEVGIGISLDDFGTGFSSLGYIRTLPIDTIKIDRAFIRDITNSHDDAVIVTSTIALAHNLGMKTVAEGIETRDQIVHLKTAGCDEGQGYLFSRPITADKVRELLEDPARTLA